MQNHVLVLTAEQNIGIGWSFHTATRLMSAAHNMKKKKQEKSTMPNSEVLVLAD